MGRWRTLEVKLFKDIFSKQELNDLLIDAKNKLKNAPAFDNTSNICVSFKNDKLVKKIQLHLFEHLNVKPNVFDMQYQCWKDGEESKLHVHDEAARSICDYNTLIYLNDDFDGGEFYTLDFIHKPITGDVTFFNGETIWHGVKPIKNNDRYTIIIWWYNTIYDSYNCSR